MPSPKIQCPAGARTDPPLIVYTHEAMALIPPIGRAAIAVIVSLEEIISGAVYSELAVVGVPPSSL
jgi:hypothetical protein